MACDEGGDAPCWAHLFDDPHDVRDREDVHRFVRDFYRQAAMDDLLGPVFVAARVDWNHHIATLVDFWMWQLFGERDYEGNPLRAHEPVHRIVPLTPAMYERWLDLFETTVDSLFEGPVARQAKARAHKMATAMERLLDGIHGPGAAPAEPAWTAGARPASR